MKRFLMRIARSGSGGWLAHIGITYLRFLLPVQVIAESDAVLLLDHPAPMTSGHSIAVPKRRVRDLPELMADPKQFAAVMDFLAAYIDPATQYIVCNLGSRQDVKQLHFHILPRDCLHGELRSVESGEGWFFCDNARCMLRMDGLQDISLWRTAVEQGCSRFPRGMSVIIW